MIVSVLFWIIKFTFVCDWFYQLGLILMKKRVFFASLIGLFQVTASFGENLLQVYQQALENDPKFKQARATWQSQKMNLPIARAAYLPQFGVQANGTRNYTLIRPISLSPIYGYNWSYGYTATLQQPLFALSAWQSIKQAGAKVKAVSASYLAAQQDLMTRTTTAYFDALKRYNILQYTIARKEAIYKQLESAKETYHAGLIAITDVYDAQSRYDVARTQEIATQNALEVSLEKLRAITGHYYTQLLGLKKDIPLSVPNPKNINTWTQAAERENYNIQSQNFTVIAAMDNIKRIATQDMPVISAAGSYAQAQSAASSGNKTTTDTAGLGLNLTYQPIQGGLINASVKQAKYDYVAASGRLEEVDHQVVETTRSSFLNILAGIGKIKSDKISIESAEKALDAASVGLRVGTRTMIDVLADLNNLYQNKQVYIEDQYDYLNNIIQLKNASGRLSTIDLVSINKELNSKITLPK